MKKQSDKIGRIALITSGILGMIGVLLGAFGAHALKTSLSSSLLEVYDTGVAYHFYHTFGIALIGLSIQLHPQGETKWLRWAYYSMGLGVLFFSGSLYALAVTGIKWFGPITPLGGLLLILGWGFFLWHWFHFRATVTRK